jgi:cytoskeleton protein RodZ
MSLESSQNPSMPQGFAMMLRQAREAKGVPIDFLASVLRVPVERLQALEEDRLQDLPDLIFARALAQSVCRQLKIDSVSVLAAMPNPDPKHSVRITAATGEPLGGMNTTPNDIKKRAVWIVVGMVLLALWAMLGTHLFDDHRPSTTVQSPGPESEPNPAFVPDPEDKSTDTENSTAPASNEVSPSVPGALSPNPAPGPKP